MSATKLTSTRGTSPQALNTTEPATQELEADSVGPQVSLRSQKPLSGFESRNRQKSPKEVIHKRLDSLNISSDLKARVQKKLDEGRDLALIQAAFSGLNADRALVLYDELVSMLQKTPASSQRLTQSIQTALLRAVSESRNQGSTGQAGLMGVTQALLAGQTVATMPEKQFRTLLPLLSQAGVGGARSSEVNADTERGLLLKSVAARADRLRPSQTDDAALARGQVVTSQADRAMEEISTFAKEVRGQPRTLLMRSTTLIDTESDINTSNADPLKLASSSDTRSDNDGLYQRYETSCVPTAAQMTKGEGDPIYARELWLEMGNKSESSKIAKQQLDILAPFDFFEEDGSSVALLPEELAAYQKDGTLPSGYTRKRSGASSLRVADDARALVAQLELELPVRHQGALRSHLSGIDLAGEELEIALKALETLRQNNNGQPTAELVQIMRANKPVRNTYMDLPGGLNALMQTSTTHFWVGTWFAESETTPAQKMDAIEALLVKGKSVPIRIGDESGGHAMLASDVRGSGSEKKILISDPYSGRTAWVPHSEILDEDSQWPGKYFELSWRGITHFNSEVSYEK